MKSTDKLAAARAKACKVAPYFRSGILTLIPIESTEVDTLAVTSTGGFMLWNSKHVDSTPLETLAGDIIHEWLHIMYKHSARGTAIAVDDHDAWNKACDAAIEDSIGALPRHSWVITPASLNLPSGMTAEGYYRELIKRKQNNAAQQKQQQSPQNKNNQKQSDKQDSGQSSQGTSSDPSQAEKQSQEQSEGNAKSEQTAQGKKEHKCGGCAGNAHAIEKEIISKEQGRTQAEMTRSVKQVAEAIKKEAARGIGNISGGLAVWADQTLAPPKINWRARLAQLVRDSITHKAGAVTHRYSKPSRRQAGLGYGMGRATLPALIAPIPRIAVAVDTSGSMGTKEINAAMAEINGILKSVGAPIDFVSFDTQAGKLTKINNINDARKNLTGGGGTDFRPMLINVGKARPSYDVVIVLTDGGGYAPPAAPAFKTIWALVGRYKSTPITASGTAINWGYTVNVDD
jgi:predicted metal-dependent peptidase